MLVGGVVCSMAFYCQRCGKIHVHDVPYFLGVKRFSLRCAGCGHEQALLVRGDKGCFEVHVPCVACNKEHVIACSLAQLRHMDLEKVYCSRDRFELGYIGKRRRIEELLAFNQADEHVGVHDGAADLRRLLCGSSIRFLAPTVHNKR